MRVLLTNHHLNDRAGSELYVSELASALRDRGHDVRLFTLLPGAQAERLKGAGFEVYTPADFAAVELFNPEVAHVHHGPCLWWAGSVKLSCPVIFSSLGVIPPHEAAPAAWPGVALGAAVSEEVRAKLASTPFGKTVELHVMRNWFDDRGWKLPKARAPQSVKRVAIVSNHLIPGIVETLNAAGVEWTHFGLPENSVEITPEVLKPFDAVVCIGRTVLLAAALGKPVLVWDYHGCDGVLDAERVDPLAAVNFSGRVSRAQPTPDELRAMLDACTKLNVGALQKVMKQRFALTTRAAEWEALYQQAIDADTQLSDENHVVYRPMFDLYWGELQNAHIHRPRELRLANDALAAERQRNAAVAAELIEAQRRAEAHEARVNDLVSRADDLTSQLMQSRLSASALRDEVELLRAQLDAASAQLRAPGAEDALRFAEKANELRTTLLPEGTKRLGAFRTALHWARKKTR